MLYNSYMSAEDFLEAELESAGNAPPADPELPPVDVAFPPEQFVIEVSLSHARAHMPELIDEVRDGATVYLTRYGKRVAAIVPAEAADYLERVEDEYWAERAEEARASGGPSIPWDQVVAELEQLDA